MGRSGGHGVRHAMRIGTMDNKLECLAKDEDIVLYLMQTECKVCTLISSTP